MKFVLKWQPLFALLSSTGTAWAQPAEAALPAEPQEPAPSVREVPTELLLQGTTPVQGPSTAQPVDLNAHLPSSSRATADTSRSQDGFDLVPGGGANTAGVRGSSEGAFVSDGGNGVPETYVVRRGDTLWDLSSQYYQNPYFWPRLWAYNPEVMNPHWIYPGDRIRLKQKGGPQPVSSLRMREGKAAVSPSTVFLRETGWVDDPNKSKLGRLIGSPTDRGMLALGDEVYLKLNPRTEIKLGQELTVFSDFEELPLGDHKRGQLVSIRGTVRVDKLNAKDNMARAKVVEVIDTIERGAFVGPVGRKFDIVPAVPSDRDVDARILGSIYPYQLLGQNQVVFLDRGEKDGLKPGFRLFAIRRGDRYLESLSTANSMTTMRPRIEDPRPAKVDRMFDEDVDVRTLPDETYAELRVVSVHDRTSVAIVTSNNVEVEPDARLFARKGF